MSNPPYWYRHGTYQEPTDQEASADMSNEELIEITEHPELFDTDWIEAVWDELETRARKHILPARRWIEISPNHPEVARRQRRDFENA